MNAPAANSNTADGEISGSGRVPSGMRGAEASGSKHGKMLTTIEILKQELHKDEMLYEKHLNAGSLNGQGASGGKHSNRKRPQTGSLNARASTSSKDGKNEAAT